MDIEISRIYRVIELRVVARGGVVDVGTSTSTSSSCPTDTKQKFRSWKSKTIYFTFTRLIC